MGFSSLVPILEETVAGRTVADIHDPTLKRPRSPGLMAESHDWLMTPPPQVMTPNVDTDPTVLSPPPQFPPLSGPASNLTFVSPDLDVKSHTFKFFFSQETTLSAATSQQFHSAPQPVLAVVLRLNVQLTQYAWG